MYTGLNHGKEDMRHTALAIAAKHGKELFNNGRSTAFCEVVKSVPAFAAELAAEILKGQEACAPRYRRPGIFCYKANTIENNLDSLSSAPPYCFYCGMVAMESHWASRQIRGDGRV